MGRYASCSVAQFVVSRNDAAPRPVRTQKYVSRAAFGAFEAPAQPLQGCIAEAFQHIRYLQHSCELQVMSQSTGAELIIPPAEVCEHTAQQFEGDGSPRGAETFAAYMRMLDREEPDYKH